MGAGITVGLEADLLLGGLLGKPKVYQLGIRLPCLGGCQEHVGGREVSEDDLWLQAMQILERAGHLQGPPAAKQEGLHRGGGQSETATATGGCRASMARRHGTATISCRRASPFSRSRFKIYHWQAAHANSYLHASTSEYSLPVLDCICWPRSERRVPADARWESSEHACPAHEAQQGKFSIR